MSLKGCLKRISILNLSVFCVYFIALMKYSSSWWFYFYLVTRQLTLHIYSPKNNFEKHDDNHHIKSHQDGNIFAAVWWLFVENKTTYITVYKLYDNFSQLT